MTKKPASELLTAVKARLRAIQAELGKSDAEMGKFLGVGRTTWGQWIGGGNMPAEEAMITLCEQAKVTMEWIYRGRPEGLPLGLAIRLELRLAGIDPDAATAKQKAEIAARVAVMAA